MRKTRLISRSKRLADILAIIFIGLASGFVIKYLDDIMTFPNLNRFSDLMIHTFALDRVFSEMAVFLVIGVALSVFASTPKRAGMNNLIYFVCLNMGYYGYMYHYWRFVLWGYILFWVVFSCVTPFLGYLVWYSKDNNHFANFLKIIIFAMMTLFTFSSVDFNFTYKGIIYLILFAMLVWIVRPNWKILISGIMLGIFIIVII